LSAGPFVPADDGVRAFLRVTPKASRNAITGLADTVDGGKALKVSVTAVPENGKANAAVIKLLAKAWGVAKSTLAVTAGASDRNKTLHIAGEPVQLSRQLADWLEKEGL